MVALPLLPERVVTTTAPQSSVTRSDIMREGDMMAGALNKVADSTMSIATDLAKEQAAEDLTQQKVVRNADGSVSTINPANSVIFGRAGEVYNDAVRAGTIAQHSNVLSEAMTDLHTKHATDPAGFKAASDAFLDNYDHGGGEAGAAILQRGHQLQTQNLNSITTSAANLDITNQQKSIQATIADQKNTLQGLARQPGGTDTPEFRGALERLQASYQALGTNPLFKMPQDQIDLELKNFRGLLQGEALVAHVDETYTKKGKAEAANVLNREILQNPNLSEADRNRLYSHGLARLQFLSADAKEKIDAGRKAVSELETNIANGTVKTTDPIIGMEIKQALDRGDAEGANRITAAVQVRQSLSGIQTLPQAVQAQVLGIAKSGVVNPAIPAEGRALLDRIASTESAGRYDVRYGGRGDKTFVGYGDHPRISEPITSGPDVGKTSSAAGRYQFIAPTWDAQAKKLGLKDFSPANQDAAAWDLAQTEYKARTGKDLLSVLRSGDTAAINDVPRQLSGQWSSLPGGRQPAGERAIMPAANGGPGFTAADLQRNPFLGSAYVRTLAADESLRIQSATQAAAGVDRALDNGLLPRAEDVALVRQTAAQYPEKFGPTAEKMDGKIMGSAVAQLDRPQREQVLASYRAATDGQDQHHMNVAAAALSQYQQSEKNLQERPYQEAATRGWIAPVAPIDPGQPDTIPAALQQRLAASQRIASMDHTPAPPVIAKDEMPAMQAALEGPAGAGVLSNLAALPTDDFHRLLEQKEFAGAVTAMMASKDPVKMSTAMSVVDKLWRENAADTEESLGKPAITRLQAWQGLRGSFNAVELAERLNASDDPSTTAARKTAKEAAEAEVKNLTPADMAYKLGTGWPVIGRLTGSTPAPPFDSIKGGEMVADFNTTYTALRTYGVDPAKASDLAVQRLQSTWGVSEAGGNQVMKNPPERSYPAVGGSHGWIGDDLREWVGKRLGPEFGGKGARSLEAGVAFAGAARNWSVEGLVADGQTQAEISRGAPPSYQVAVKKADGTTEILPARIAFDPTNHIAKYGTTLEQQRLSVDYLRTGQFENAMPQP